MSKHRINTQTKTECAECRREVEDKRCNLCKNCLQRVCDEVNKELKDGWLDEGRWEEREAKEGLR